MTASTHALPAAIDRSGEPRAHTARTIALVVLCAAALAALVALAASAAPDRDPLTPDGDAALYIQSS